MKPHLRLAQARARVIRTLAGRADPTARERAIVDALRAVHGVRDVELWSAERARDLPMPSPFGGSSIERNDGVQGWAIPIEATTLDLNDVDDRSSRLLVVPIWGDDGCRGALAVRTHGRPDQDTLDQIRALTFCARELLDEVREPAAPAASRSQLSAVFGAIVDVEPQNLAVVDMSAGARPLFAKTAPAAGGTLLFVPSIAAPGDRERLERLLCKAQPKDPPAEIVVRTHAAFPWTRVGIQVVTLADRIQCILQDRSHRETRSGKPSEWSSPVLPRVQKAMEQVLADALAVISDRATRLADGAKPAADEARKIGEATQRAKMALGQLATLPGRPGLESVSETGSTAQVSLNREVQRVTGLWRVGPGRDQDLELDLRAHDDTVCAPAGALDALLWTLLTVAVSATTRRTPPRLETRDGPRGVSLRVSPATGERDTGRQVVYLVGVLEGTLERTTSKTGEIRLEISLPGVGPRARPDQDSLPVETRGS